MKNKKRLLKVILISTFILLFVYLIAEKNIFNKQNVIDLFTASEKGAHFKVFFMAITTLFVIFFVPISWFTALAAFFFGFKGFLYVISSGITACISYKKDREIWNGICVFFEKHAFYTL